jgi:hypothetical protein
MQRSVEVSRVIRAGFAHVREVLSDDAGAVFRDRGPTRASLDLSTRTELSVDLGAGASVHQEVLVELGIIDSTESWLAIPVSWQASGRKRLFPTFFGELEACDVPTGTQLRLHGAYTVPLGALGSAGNGVGGWRLARRSLDALVTRLGWRLELEADRRRRSVSRRQDGVAPPWERSEIYLG